MKTRAGPVAPSLFFWCDGVAAGIQENISVGTMVKDQMDKIYKDLPLEKIPWNVETPPEILQKTIQAIMTKGSKAMELGCGAGNYVIYFAKMGYEMTGVDISGNAIDIAKRSAASAGVTCRFSVADVLGDLEEIKEPFDVVYDWELLHHIFPEDRGKYIQNVHRMLKDRGWYLSVCFSEENSHFGGTGKYRETPLGTVLYFSSESELESLFREYFAIQDLRTIDIPGKQAVHKAIYALMRKKNG